MLVAELPDLEPLLNATYSWTNEIVKFVHGINHGPEGLSPLVTQAANDFLDLISDICRGRGRPALRAARSLYEVLITLHDIIDSPEAAERYSRHRFVVLQQLATLDLGENLLPKKHRSAALHAKKKLLKKYEQDFDQALRDYGPGFKRGWATSDLYSRGSRFGLSGEYEFYRLASGILHVSSGGGIGLVSEISGQIIHRQGPALELCPLAFLYGVWFFRAFVARLGSDLGGPRHEELEEHLAMCLGYWAEYRRGIRKIDASLWPADPEPPSVLPVLAFASLPQVRRWYLWDQNSNLICEATPPESLPEKQQTIIESFIREHRTQSPSSTELITAVVVGAPARPKPGAKWQPGGRVMSQRAFGKLRTVDLGGGRAAIARPDQGPATME